MNEYLGHKRAHPLPLRLSPEQHLLLVRFTSRLILILPFVDFLFMVSVLISLFYAW